MEGETRFLGKMARHVCEPSSHADTQARNQTLSVPAARITLKYHLLAYVSHIKAGLRASAGGAAFHRVMPALGSLSGAGEKVVMMFGGGTVNLLCCYSSYLIKCRGKAKM